MLHVRSLLCLSLFVSSLALSETQYPNILNITASPVTNLGQCKMNTLELKSPGGNYLYPTSSVVVN